MGKHECWRTRELRKEVYEHSQKLEKSLTELIRRSSNVLERPCGKKIVWMHQGGRHPAPTEP